MRFLLDSGRGEEGSIQQANEEEAKTKARMTEILEQLKKTKIKKVRP